MAIPLILSLRDKRANLATAGGKGASLVKMINASLPVPDGFHVTTEAYSLFVEKYGLKKRINTALKSADPAKPETLKNASQEIRRAFGEGEMPKEIARAITRVYAKMPGDGPSTAVRSSATAEDLPGLSFAGQQETYLNVRGIEHVLEAVKRCWASLWTARAIGYRIQNGIDQETIRLAVVVQTLVQADSAGIMFTANPVNGRRDQSVISASWGLGEAVVGGLVTPDTFTVDKNSHTIINREIADKETMTVLLENGTEEQPIAPEQQSRPTLEDDKVIELAKIGARIEELYGMPMDIEWALAKGKFAIVQARPITALPEPAADSPTEWQTPFERGMFMRASIIEQLPDPASPLFGTLAPEQMTRSISVMVQHVMPKLTYVSDIMGFITINDYFYMFIQFGGGKFLRLYLDALPAFFKRGDDAILKMGPTYWQDEILPLYKEKIAIWESTPVTDRKSIELLDGATDMLYWGTRLFTGVQLVMPVVTMSEGLFTLFYNWFMKRKKDPKAAEFMLGFESHPIRAEKALYDLAIWTKEQPALKALLLKLPTKVIREALDNNRPEKGISQKLWDEWISRLYDYLEEYGHAIFNLDFVNAVVTDDPRSVIDTIKFYLNGRGVDPYKRQKELAKRREAITAATIQRLGPIRRRIFQKRLKWAQETAPYREDSLAAVGLGWPLLRRMLRELGERLVLSGVIEQKDDIYWLEANELRQLAEEMDRGTNKLGTHSNLVENRKMIWRGQKQAPPPSMLPERSGWFWNLYKKLMPGGDESQTGPVIKGLSIGGGSITAPARVLHGPEDFGQMQPGDVLVAGITTPAWTPLFAMASAVVTDVGGMMSHSSIVAREYGIPAVTATGVATKRIKSGQLVRVDGDAGTVALLDELNDEGGDGKTSSTKWDVPDPKATYARGSLAEHLPSPVSPLFRTMGLRIANNATERLFASVLGTDPSKVSMFIEDGMYVPINSYVYGAFRLTLRDAGPMIRMSISQVGPMMRGSVPRWRKAREKFAAKVTEWEMKDVRASSPSDLLEGARTVYKAAAEYYTVIQTTLPAASMSEVFFSRFYKLLIKRKSDPKFTTLLFGFETIPVRAEKSLFDIATWVKEQAATMQYLTATPTEVLQRDLKGAKPPKGITSNIWAEWRQRFESHFSQFGQTAYEFDFAVPTPEENPCPQLEAVKHFLQDKATSPYDRHRKAVEARERAEKEIQARLGWPRRGWFDKLLKWAQEAGAIREDSIADMGLGHPFIRTCFAELGGRFAAGGAIEAADDIYWLEEKEVEELTKLLEKSQQLKDLRDRVGVRRAEWQVFLRLTPPVGLPQKSFLLRFLSRGDPEEKDGKTILKGLGTSSGEVTAIARVLFGPQDFKKMRPGDVLVATTTTPAWTPLFALASAVITDIGGPLSHSSIVAREYGIPAVMAVRDATRLIRSGELITVNGAKGTVALERR